MDRDRGHLTVLPLLAVQIGDTDQHSQVFGTARTPAGHAVSGSQNVLSVDETTAAELLRKTLVTVAFVKQRHLEGVFGGWHASAADDVGVDVIGSVVLPVLLAGRAIAVGSI